MLSEPFRRLIKFQVARYFCIEFKRKKSFFANFGFDQVAGKYFELFFLQAWKILKIIEVEKKWARRTTAHGEVKFAINLEIFKFALNNA